jgi:prepilin-type processing-associated H-X9-DG protein
MLNTRTHTSAQTEYPGGKVPAPFVSFLSAADMTHINNPKLQRNMSMVRKGSELIMLVEASNNNWYDQNASTSQPPLYLRRLGARHGKRSGDGRNAFTNFAFFDGHVGLYPTEPFQKSADYVATITQETIFVLSRQK